MSKQTASVQATARTQLWMSWRLAMQACPMVSMLAASLKALSVSSIDSPKWHNYLTLRKPHQPHQTRHLHPQWHPPHLTPPSSCQHHPCLCHHLEPSSHCLCLELFWVSPSAWFCPFVFFSSFIELLAFSLLFTTCFDMSDSLPWSRISWHSSSLRSAG